MKFNSEKWSFLKLKWQTYRTKKDFFPPKIYDQKWFETRYIYNAVKQNNYLYDFITSVVQIKAWQLKAKKISMENFIWPYKGNWKKRFPVKQTSFQLMLLILQENERGLTVKTFPKSELSLFCTLKCQSGTYVPYNVAR